MSKKTRKAKQKTRKKRKRCPGCKYAAFDGKTCFSRTDCPFAKSKQKKGFFS